MRGSGVIAWCLSALLLAACGDSFGDTSSEGAGASMASSGSGGGGAAGAGGSGGGGAAEPASVPVTLVAEGVTGVTRVNFAVPLPAGQLSSADDVNVLAAGNPLPSARRGLAPREDGSFRSVQLQVEVDVSRVSELEVRLGEAAAGGDLSLVPVVDTLVAPDGEQGPSVWALMEPRWLSSSGFAGPLLPEQDTVGDAAAWADLCDYEAWDTEAFVDAGASTDAGVWLYDRGTVFYRGYARRGELAPLRSAYIETSMYRNGITGTGMAARNGVPGRAEDPKYTYAQNLALHYLLTGDDRFRESAEDMAQAMSALWINPQYEGGADFWTERHAGFSLLAYVWAAKVSDDQASTFWAMADNVTSAYLSVQATYPPDYQDPAARCFAHHADAHGEPYGYFGCSPWMSAILADGLWAYRDGGFNDVTDSLVQLGRIIARDGRDAEGKPYYWMGVGTEQDELDPYDEHIGESAYIVAMAAWLSRDPELQAAADELTAKLAADGAVGQLRSFNWQCRSAVATSWFLQR